MASKGISCSAALFTLLAINQMASASSVKSITLSPANINQPGSVSANIVLLTPAPVGGQLVTFSTTSPYISTAPSITIPEGQTTGVGTIGFAGGQTADTTAVISASTLGSKISAVLHIYATKPIHSLVLAAPDAIAGLGVRCQLTMAAKIPVDSVVPLSSTGPCTVPASVTIPANTLTAIFTVTPTNVLSNTGITVTATPQMGSPVTVSSTVMPGWTYIAGPAGSSSLSQLLVNPAGTQVAFTDPGGVSNNTNPSLNVIALGKDGSQLWKHTSHLPPQAAGFAPYYGFVGDYRESDGTILPVVLNNQLANPTGGALVYPYSQSGVAGTPYSCIFDVENTTISPQPLANGDLAFYDENGGATFSGSTQTSSWSWPTPAQKTFSTVTQAPDGTLYAKGSDGSGSTKTEFIIRLGAPDPSTHVRPVLQVLTTAAGTTMSDPVYGHGNIYVTSHPSSTVNGTLTALNPDLSIKWQYSPGEEISDNEFIRTFTTTPNYVVIVSATRVLAVKPTGVLGWQVHSLDPHSPNITGNFDYVYGAPDGTLYDLNAAAGGSIGTTTVRGFTPGGSQKWRTNFAHMGIYQSGSIATVAPDSTLYLPGYISGPGFTGSGFHMLGFLSNGSSHFEVDELFYPSSFFPDSTGVIGFIQDIGANQFTTVAGFKWTP